MGLFKLPLPTSTSIFEPLNLDKVERILFVMTGGIGNLIMTIPALRALRKAFPGKSITLMTGEPGVEDIIFGDRLVDEVALHDRRVSRSFIDKASMILEMRRRKFDLALVASRTNPFKASLLTYCMGIPVRVGEDIGGRGYWYTDKVGYSDETHELDGALEVVRRVGISPGEVYPRITVPQKDTSFVDAYFSGKHGLSSSDLLIGMHVGCGYLQTYRRWPKERFIDVANRLVEEHGARILLTGKQEKDLVDEVAEKISNQPINSAAELTLLQTAAAVKRCRLFIANDSGLAHISTAVDVPVIVLFGFADEKRTAPRGKSVHLIRKGKPGDDDALTKITVEEVFETANRLLRRMGEAL